MPKPLITALSILGIVGSSGVAFATNMQALDVQATQDVSGGSGALVPSAPATAGSGTPTGDPTTPPAAAPETNGAGKQVPALTSPPSPDRTTVQLPGPAAPAAGHAQAPEVAPAPHAQSGGSGTSANSGRGESADDESNDVSDDQSNSTGEQETETNDD